MMSIRTSTILRLLKIQAVLSVVCIVFINSKFLNHKDYGSQQSAIDMTTAHQPQSQPDILKKIRVPKVENEHEPHRKQVDESKSSYSKTWFAKSPWDAPPDGFYGENDTGSLQNCTTMPSPTSDPQGETSVQSVSLDPENDSGTITVSCHAIKFRAPLYKIQNVGPIIVGVLSAASGSGPQRRSYIRKTWAHSHKGSTFFLVAGPWKDIEKEFWKYRDLIWIDEEEVYQGEKSVLTYKTISYFAIAHLFGKKVQDGGWMHAIKTDDDSYVNVGRLLEKLTSDDGEFRDYHYYGQCPQFQVLPSRDKTNKWPVTYQTYPEPKFPLYCQGAGFGLSRKLVQRAVENDHIAKFRYMPFEDVSIGILAERCGKKFHATMIPGVKVFRADTPKERDCVNHAVPMSKCYEGDETWPPDALMSNKLIQHRVDGKEDMIAIHTSLGLEIGR
jgi:hypothetical protein